MSVPSGEWATAWRRRSDAHPRTADAVTAVVLFGVSVSGAFLSGPDVDWWTALVPAAVASAALMWRHRHPRAVVAVTTACTMAEAVQGHLLTPMLMGQLMLALYGLAARSDRKTTWTYAITVTALLVATAVLVNPGHHPIALRTFNPSAWILLPAALGRGVKVRRAFTAAQRAHAEHAREEEARHRVAEERMRIARELHDVVAHHLALANAQAGTAAVLARTNPEAMRDLLDDLAGTTAAALRELKATVGLLRQPDDPDAPLEPAPGIGLLPELAASFASVGLDVEVAADPMPGDLSPGVEVTAYRIVQEALTNAAKHSGASTARVRVACTAERLTVTVTDEGAGRVGGVAADRAPAAAENGEPVPGGFGLIGMRERAQSVGGRLAAGPRPTGGFQVTADLPLHPRPRKDQPTP
ncbi:MAG: sensor histidine kinase [Streptomycetaceae bacterium]|nr:sensor histidine kinase [Streptomycetaceae bacterium]